MIFITRRYPASIGDKSMKHRFCTNCTFLPAKFSQTSNRGQKTAKLLVSLALSLSYSFQTRNTHKSTLALTTRILLKLESKSGTKSIYSSPTRGGPKMFRCGRLYDCDGILLLLFTHPFVRSCLKPTVLAVVFFQNEKSPLKIIDSNSTITSNFTSFECYSEV